MMAKRMGAFLKAEANEEMDGGGNERDDKRFDLNTDPHARKF